MENQTQTLPAVFSDVPSLSPLQIRYKICEFEELLRQELLAGRLPARDFPALHHFDLPAGKCLRSMFLPAGSLVVGKLHRHEHPNFISLGKVTMFTEHGGLETLQAPCHMVSPAGTKRVLFVHEDTIWTVEHEATSTDLDELEQQVIAPSYSALGWEDPCLAKQLSATGAKGE